MATETEDLAVIRQLLQTQAAIQRRRANRNAVILAVLLPALLCVIGLVIWHGGRFVDAIAERSERARISFWEKRLAAAAAANEKKESAEATRRAHEEFLREYHPNRVPRLEEVER
jgi:hypothetical protein